MKEGKKILVEFLNQSFAFQQFVEFYVWLQSENSFLSCNRAQLRFSACENRLLQTGFFNKTTKKLFSAKEIEFYSNFSQFLSPNFNSSSTAGVICDPLLTDETGFKQNETDSCFLQKIFSLKNYITEAKKCIEQELFTLLNESLIDKLTVASNEYITSLAELKSHLDDYRGKFVWNLDFYRYVLDILCSN